jgi:hypothetical protein
MSLTSSCTLALNAIALSGPAIGSSTYALAETLTAAALTTGAGANQASYIWTARRTLLTTASESLAMETPAARDALGQTLALTKIKLLYIKNRSVVVGDTLVIGGEGTGAAWNSLMNVSDTKKLVLQPGGTLLVVAPSAAGYAVAASTNSLLKIENPGAHTVEYDIVIIGS